MRSATLLVLQSAVAVTVLTTGVLLVRSFAGLAYQPLGFDPSAVRAVDIDLDGRVAGQQRQERWRLYELLRERLQVPVTLAGGWPALTLPARLTRQDATGDLSVPAYPAAGTFFDVFGIRLTSGRLYSDAEAFADATVAVVDRRAAARLWPGLDPLGRAVVDSAGIERVVVGVVDTLRTNLTAQEATGTAFIPFGPRARFLFAMRDANDEVSVAQLRSAIQDMAPGAIVSLRPLQPFERTLGQPRFLAALLGTLALLTIALASVGVFGVVNHQALTRTREIGIRIALGAEAGSIRRLVLWRALLPTALGIALGVGALLLWTPTLQSLLFGLESNDVGTFVLSGAAVFATVFAASAWPAWRVSRVDPLLTARGLNRSAVAVVHMRSRMGFAQPRERTNRNVLRR